MAFQRNHVSDADRLAIGLYVFRCKSMYEVITDLARKYRVSRWFIYDCYTQFLLVFELHKARWEPVTPLSGYCATLEEGVVKSVFGDRGIHQRDPTCAHRVVWSGGEQWEDFRDFA